MNAIFYLECVVKELDNSREASEVRFAVDEPWSVFGKLEAYWRIANDILAEYP
jgi:hypothetical protein